MVMADGSASSFSPPGSEIADTLSLAAQTGRSLLPSQQI